MYQTGFTKLLLCWMVLFSLFLSGTGWSKYCPKPVFSYVELDEIGLYLRQNNMMLTGVPTYAGTFSYWMTAKNKYSYTKPFKINFRVDIDPLDIDPKDTPVFRQDAYLPAASSEEAYAYIPLKIATDRTQWSKLAGIQT